MPKLAIYTTPLYATCMCQTSNSDNTHTSEDYYFRFVDRDRGFSFGSEHYDEKAEKDLCISKITDPFTNESITCQGLVLQ